MAVEAVADLRTVGPDQMVAVYTNDPVEAGTQVAITGEGGTRWGCAVLDSEPSGVAGAAYVTTVAV